MLKHVPAGRFAALTFPRLLLAAVIALAGFAPASATAQQNLPTPEAHFGFVMGEAENLARWDGILDYYTVLSNGTDRMVVDTLGMTTLGNPFVAVWISSPANLARLDEIRAGSSALAAGRIDEAEARRISESIPSTVVIHHNIHSNEIGASQTSVQLVYDLVSAEGGVESEILNDVITVLIPSGNPDGQIMITDWYRSVLGTDFEDSGMPFLYHHYAGHDNNRDFFQANLVETQYWMDLMFEQAFPQIYLDQHQMGSSGPRIFVPPYPDPMDPKIHPLQWQSLQFMGGGIVADLQAAGKQGVITGEMYRIWGQEGALTGRHHNIVSLLTETASSNLASPVDVSRAQLERSRNLNTGQQPYGFQISFPDPWWGGEWTLQDIVDYQMVSAMSVLTQAARFRDMYLFRRWQMASETIEKAATEGPYAYVVPPEQMDAAAATDMVRRLSLQGVEIHRALADFEAVPGVEPVPNSWARDDEEGTGGRNGTTADDGDDDEGADDDGDNDEGEHDGADNDAETRTFPAGSWVIMMQQNARAALLDLLEIQDRELLYEYPGGPILRSYDGAAYTMPLQMGVEAVRIDDAFQANLEMVDEVTFPAPGFPQAEQYYVLDGAVTASYAAVNELMANGISVSRRGDDFIVPSFQPEARAILEHHHTMKGLPVDVDPEEMMAAAPIRRSRIGLYQGWSSSMDEGWTRLMLDEYGFDYEVLRGPDVAAGDLGERFDAILVPGQMSVNQIIEGRDAEDYPEEYVGGIGEDGLEALKAFVREGGTLVTLDSSDQLVLNHFDVPVESAVQGLGGELFQPASIYRLDLDEDHELTRGSVGSVAAKWAGGRAWQPTSFGGEGDVGRIRTVGHWPSNPDDILMSGLLVGAEHLAGKAAILDIEYGTGRIYMYGFRVQHRMQTTGTLKLLFNAFVPVSPRTATQQ